MGEVIDFLDKKVELTDDPEVVEQAIIQQTEEIYKLIKRIGDNVESFHNCIVDIEKEIQDINRKINESHE